MRRTRGETRHKLKHALGLLGALFALLPAAAHAQESAQGGFLGLFAALSALPFLLLALTCFAKIFIVLLLLRAGLSTPGIPPGSLLAALALSLTALVMAPVVQEIALLPETGQLIERVGRGDLPGAAESAPGALAPLLRFLSAYTRPEDRELMEALALRLGAPGEGILPMVPAFILSELREAFRLGVVVLLPFLAIDLALGAILYGLGISQIDPKTAALPIKLALLLATDGLSLLARSLLLSYTGTGGP